MIRSKLFPLLLALLALFVVAACDEDDDPPPTNAQSYSRSDAELQALADQAWAQSGYPGTPTSLNDANAGSVGDGALGAVDSGMSSGTGGVAAVTTSALYTRSLQLMWPDIARSAAAAAQELRSSPQATQTITISGTYNCLGGGTVTGTGSVTVTSEGTQTSGTYTLSINNVEFQFNGCKDASFAPFWEVYGSVRINADESFSASQTSASSVSGRFAFDDYLDGGLAINESDTNYYRLLFRFTQLGAISFTVDTNTGNLTSASGTINVTMRVNNVSCEANVTITGIDTATGSYSCTVS